MLKATLRLSALLLTLSLFACNQDDEPASTQKVTEKQLGVQDAVAFVANAETELAELLSENERMAWVQSNFITQDTEILAALTNKRFTGRQVELAVEAARYYWPQSLGLLVVRKYPVWP